MTLTTSRTFLHLLLLQFSYTPAHHFSSIGPHHSLGFGTAHLPLYSLITLVPVYLVPYPLSRHCYTTGQGGKVTWKSGALWG